MRHPLPRESGHAFRHNHRQPLHHAAFLLRHAASLQPENPTGQRAIDGRLRLLVVYSDNRESALSLTHPAAQVSRAERMFEIDAGTESDHSPAGKVSLQRAAQARFVGNPLRPPRRRRTLIAITAEIQPGGPSLTHALHLQPERRRPDFRIQHPPHKIPLMRPQVQQALVVLAGNRILRLGQIERDGAIFHHHGGARAVKKIGEHLAERFWGHAFEGQTGPLDGHYFSLCLPLGYYCVFTTTPHPPRY